MTERLKTIVIVTALALAFWVFAEAESLESRSINARLDIAAAPAEAGELRVTISPDFAGRLTIEARGPRVALDEVQRILQASPISLTPDEAGLAIDDGPFTIDLNNLIQNLPAVIEANVEVVSVRPGQLSGTLLQLETVEVPIVAALAGIDAETAPTISPQTATVRIPRRLETAERDALRAIAAVNADDLGQNPTSDSVSVRVPIQLPERFAKNENINLLGPDAATLAITIRSTASSAEVDALLWATLPAGQTGRYEILVNPADRVIPVTVTGPRDAVSRVESGEWPIVGIVALDAAQLLEDTVAEDIRWFTLVGGGLQALPAAIQIQSDKTSVTVNITPTEAAPSP